VAASVAALIVSATPLAAQDISINFGQGTAGGGLNERIIQLIALLTVLSLAPSILVMMTSFTRIVVVRSLLRTAPRPRRRTRSSSRWLCSSPPSSWGRRSRTSTMSA
jgi:flagellar biosynthesis protein FliP